MVNVGIKSVNAVDTLLRTVQAKITPTSRRNLIELARLQPELGRGLFKMIREMPRPVASIVIPASVLAPENQGILRDPAHLRSAQQPNKFDLRQAGLRAKPVVTVIASTYEPLALSVFSKMLGEAKAEFRKDPELAALFLFKLILRLRVELYRAGEERSKLKKAGAAVQNMTELGAYIGQLVAEFPFSQQMQKSAAAGRGQQRSISEQLALAAKSLTEKSNNTAANAALVPVTERLEEILFWQQRQRLSQGSRTKEWKVELSSERNEKGKWVIHQTGYRKSVVDGLVHKAQTRAVVSTAKLVSMIGHEIDQINAELRRNEGFLAQLPTIRAGLPDGFDRVYDLYQTFSHYVAWHKEKACVEFEAALQLLLVGSDQAVKLADSLLSLATRDIEQRQSELKQQIQAMTSVKEPAERKIADRLIEFTIQAAEIMSQPWNLVRYDQLERLERRLGGVLGSYFKEEMREPWLQKAKAKIVGLKNALPKLNDRMMPRAEKIAKLKRGAEFILQIGLLYENRNGGTTSKESFLARHHDLLARFDRL